MRIKRMLGLGALVLLCSSSAFAQKRFELQPFVGTKFGGTLELAPNTKNIARAHFGTGVAGGVSFAYNATPHLGLEFLWNRQSTNVSGELNSGATFPQTIDVTLDQYHGNFLFTLRHEDAKLRPFLLFGLGATTGSGAGVSETKFSYAIGGGVKYFFAEHFGLRAQMRYAPTYTYTTVGGLWCNWWGFCWVVPNDHYLQQGDATVGLIIRF